MPGWNAAVRLGLAIVLLSGLVRDLPPGAQARALSPERKVAPWVLAHTHNGARASFLVVLTAQAATDGAAALPTKAARGRYVFDRLYATAQATQGPLKAYLAARGVPYQAYWIVNMLAVSGDRRLALDLAARADVARIAANPSVPLALPTPEQRKAYDQTVRGAAALVEWGLQNTNAPGAWALGYEGAGIVVAASDTGFRWTHAALRGKYRGWNGATADHNYHWWDAIHSGGGACGPNSPQPCDDSNHGTHVLGTLVGGDGNGPDSNDVGMAYGARWIGCRSMDQGFGTPQTFVECHQFMLAPTDLNGQNPNPDLAPHVLANAWYCPAAAGCTDVNVLRQSIAALVAAGIVYVAPAQAGGPSCATIADPPGIYELTFTTTAHNLTNGLASFAGRGPVLADGSGRRKPDISGPGVNVRSASSAADDAYVIFSGTSMAAPHLAGAVALLLSARPELIGQVDQIIQVIENSARPDLAVTGGPTSCGGIPYTTIPNNHFGYGRLDVLAAIQSVPQQTPTPTVTGTPPATATATASAPPATATSTASAPPATATSTASAPPATATSTPGAPQFACYLPFSAYNAAQP